MSSLPFFVGYADMDLVSTARACAGRIERVGHIGRRDDDDVSRGAQAVIFGEQRGHHAALELAPCRQRELPIASISSISTIAGVLA
jgi:hypothetical protein